MSFSTELSAQGTEEGKLLRAQGKNLIEPAFLL
jgi:hypothetical protein